MFGPVRWLPCILIAFLCAAPAFAQEATWRAQTSGTTESLSGVSFGSATTGVAVGANATILRTSDGGIRWEKGSKPSGLDGTNCCSGVRFFNTSVVWLVGSGAIVRSGSSGSSWFGQSYSTHTRRAIAPTASDTSWTTGNGSSGGRLFYRMTITGNNFSTKSVIQAATDTMYSIDFTDADNGWAVGAPGRIVRITAGSGSDTVFTNQTSGTTAALRSIDMVNSTSGWAVGDNGTILRTTDGGTTWTKQNSGTVNSLRSVSFKNTSEGIAVGTAGLILATTDGGATWRMEPSGVSADLLDVHHGLVTIAVGAGGTIVKRSTSPGGCDYSVNPKSSLYSAGGGSPSFTVTTPAECAWTAVSDSSWLAVTSGGSGSGNGTVTLTVSPNTASQAREGHIAVGTTSFTATQYGTSGSCPFTLTATPSSFRGSGGTGTLEVTTLTGCAWIASSSSWITVDNPAAGFNFSSGSIKFHVDPYSTGFDRTGTISISGSNSSVTITQSSGGTARRRAVRR